MEIPEAGDPIEDEEEQAQPCASAGTSATADHQPQSQRLWTRDLSLNNLRQLQQQQQPHRLWGDETKK